MFTDFCKRVHD